MARKLKMGLDSYLTGDRYVPEFQNNLPRAKIDNFPVESYKLNIGYWRKFWALHNFITENFGENGCNECSKINLDVDDLLEIAKAVEDGLEIKGDEISVYYVAETAKIFRNAAEWLSKKDYTWKSVDYRGSW
jgi:hypothetical protein